MVNKSYKIIYFGLSIIIVFLLGVVHRYVLPLTGDSLADYDYFYFEANHIASYGKLAYWNPFLYIGQKTVSRYLLHFISSPDAWLTSIMSLLGNPISFATIFSLSRAFEWLSVYGGTYLLGRHLKIHHIASFFLGTVICLSYSQISQIWPFHIALQWLWVLYFILRFQKRDTFVNAIFMTLSVIYMLFSTNVVGLMMCVTPLALILIHKKMFRLFKRPMVLLSIIMLCLIYLFPLATILKEESKYFHYANRSTGSHFTFKGNVAEKAIKKTQKILNSEKFDIGGVLLAKEWSDLKKKIQKSNLYIVQDIGGFGGIGLHILAIIGFFLSRGHYKWRILGCLCMLFLLARFPILLIKLPLPDILVFILNIRYFAFLFGTLKIFTAILAAFGISESLRAERISQGNIFAIIITACIVLYFLKGGIVSLLPAVLILIIFVRTSMTKIRILKGCAIALLILSIGEYINIQQKLIYIDRDSTIISSASDRKDDYTFRNLTFSEKRKPNPIHPKYPFQNAAQQLDTPLPVRKNGKKAGIWAFYMARCYHSLLVEKTYNQVNSLNGVEHNVIEFFKNESVEKHGKEVRYNRLKQNGVNNTGDKATSQLSFHYEISYNSANKLEFDIITPESGVIRMAILADPRWHAFVDGTEVQINNVDHCFQAIEVEKGKHKVKLRYVPILLPYLAFMVYILAAVVFIIRIATVISGLIDKTDTRHLQIQLKSTS